MSGGRRDDAAAERRGKGAERRGRTPRWRTSWRARASAGRSPRTWCASAPSTASACVARSSSPRCRCSTPERDPPGTGAATGGDGPKEARRPAAGLRGALEDRQWPAQPSHGAVCRSCIALRLARMERSAPSRLRRRPQRRRRPTPVSTSRPRPRRAARAARLSAPLEPGATRQPRARGAWPQRQRPSAELRA